MMGLSPWSLCVIALVALATIVNARRADAGTTL